MNICVLIFKSHDLYYFIRKAMEKFQWKENIGKIILDAYESERKLEETEKLYIGLSLAYPEKFWKTAEVTIIQIKHGFRKKMWKNWRRL